MTRAAGWLPMTGVPAAIAGIVVFLSAVLLSACAPPPCSPASIRCVASSC